MGACLCDQCAALCCRYFALPIDNPDTRRDYEAIRWYLLHENVVAFIEKKQWYVGILNKCKELQPDNRCGIYETRPFVCRKYSTNNCDYHGGEYNFEKLFTSADDLGTYADEQLEKRRAKLRTKLRKQKARGKASVAPGRGVAAKLGRMKSIGNPITKPTIAGKPNGRAISLPLLGG